MHPRVKQEKSFKLEFVQNNWCSKGRAKKGSHMGFQKDVQRGFKKLSHTRFEKGSHMRFKQGSHTGFKIFSHTKFKRGSHMRFK